MQDLKRHHPIIGEHPLIKEVFRLARRVAPCDLAVNISGETGTGKELLARFIHDESLRKKGPFVSVDCGVLTIETARSELFGHVRGAFTGAHDTRSGLVAEAAGGTLFLDEIGELDLDLQLRLLRLIQEGEFRRLGESRVQRADVRLITATHRDLEALVREKKFRADLFYRLQMVPLFLPPLRSRSSDIPMLVDYFGGVYSGVGRPRLFTRAALDVLSRYPWPGNVRELRHEIVRLMLMSDEEQIDEMCLAARIRETPGDRDTYALPFKEARRINIEQFVTEYLHRQLLRTRGNVTLAARESGVGRQYFQMQMSACGLQSKAYKQASSIAR